MTNRRRQVADAVSGTVTTSQSNSQIASNNSSNTETPSMKRSTSVPGPIGGGNPIPDQSSGFVFKMFTKPKEQNEESNTINTGTILSILKLFTYLINKLFV